ncbi:MULTISPECIES: hypothetical protein [unclassified Exiguobacterium]|uniref:hypothetical protein n=1 Tax=unclassified Exiguobacterium TaxID=2644629 RepID=UPI0025BBB544|nr:MULTISPECIES: hypothetical protein [unclassified Exiguobacterium]
MTSQNQAETVQQREERVRNRWKQDQVFARSIEQRTEAEFVFYEGPPTAATRELRTRFAKRHAIVISMKRWAID